jgi:hypothetical protein
VIDRNISLRRVVARCQSLQKKAQDFASLPQAVKARYASQRHTAGFRGLRRENYERIIIRTGGGYLGNHLDCDFPAAGPVAAPVSIFWRFAVASLTMMVVLLALRRLRKLALRDHLFACFRDAAFSALTSGVFTPQRRTSIPGWSR